MTYRIIPYVINLALLVLVKLASSQGLFINEIMALNKTTLTDVDGNYCDWIEIYNGSSEALNLKGYFLSDDPDNLNKWTFPSVVINAADYLLVYASGSDSSNCNFLHTNFKISSQGEPIFFSDSSGTIIDQLNEQTLGVDESYGRIADGGIELATFYQCSPGQSNCINTILNQISSSHSAGFYSDSIEFSIASSLNNNTIYYTLDGSEPTLESTMYEVPLIIKSRENDPLSLSEIPTTPLSGPSQLEDYIWESPNPNPFLSTVVRYRSFINESPSSRIISKSFFVSEHNVFDFDFPVISIITDSNNLFHYDTGIYIPGKRYDSLGWGTYHPEGNYMYNGSAWERKAHIEIFEPEGNRVIQQDCGMRIHGGWSAMYPQKSLRLTAKDMYGKDRFEYSLFPNQEGNSYKEFILRNSGNDMVYSFFRDVLMQNLISRLDMETQDFRPSIVFINGEYWGIHNIREQYSENYFERHFGVHKDSLSIIGVCGNPLIGDNSDYIQIIQFIKNNDLSSQPNFDSVATIIDIENFTDYHIGQIYFANFDWPCNNNKAWKSNSPSSKWRWLNFDFDGGFGFKYSFDYNKIEYMMDTSIMNYCYCSTILFRKLMENENYVDYFSNRMALHLKTTFHVDTILQQINLLQDLFETEMPDHIDRWRHPDSYLQWEREIQVLRDFALLRPCYVAENIIQVLDLDDFDYSCENLAGLGDPDFKYKIFPNPTRDFFYIRNNNIESSSLRITLFDTSGKIYIEQSMNLRPFELCQISLPTISKGLYIMQIIDEYSTITKKIIIE